MTMFDFVAELDFSSCNEDNEMDDNRSEYNVGDHVICKLKNRQFVQRYENFDEKVELNIIGKAFEVSSWEYVAFVPQHIEISLPRSSVLYIDDEILDYYCVNKKYKNQLAVILTRSIIFKTSYKADGMNCCKCDDFYKYAESNQENGTLICWSCRQNPYR